MGVRVAIVPALGDGTASRSPRPQLPTLEYTPEGAESIARDLIAAAHEVSRRLEPPRTSPESAP